MFNFPAMLDSLPHLVSLQCTSISNLAIVDLLDIVSHSTLKELYIDECVLADDDWHGYRMKFPINVEDDERALKRQTTDCKRRGDIEEESETVTDALADDASDSSSQLTSTPLQANVQEGWFAVEVRRMRAALTRTQPSKCSCRVRLALADWLHRQLRRGKLPTDDRSFRPRHPKSLLRCYRKQVALLRSIRRRQVSELAVTVPTEITASPADESLVVAVSGG